MVLQEEFLLPTDLNQAVDSHSRTIKCPFEVPLTLGASRALERQEVSLEAGGAEQEDAALLLALEKFAFPRLGDDVLFHLSTETTAPWVLHSKGTWGCASGGPREELGVANRHHLLATQMKKEGMLTCALQFIVEHFPDKKIKLPL